jgi:hypothetical protein
VAEKLVLDWYNNCILSWANKYPALYLYGESNSGKTTLINDWLFKDIKEYNIFRPARGCRFAWATYDCTRHHVVLLDEFKFEDVDVEEWKQIVEGRPTSIRVKMKESVKIIVKSPIIMLSNTAPLDRNDILNRLNVIELTRENHNYINFS